MNYSFTCDMGHEPQTFTVEAESDDEAVTKLMEATKPHVMEVHPDMTSTSPEETADMIRSKMVKSE